MILDCDDSLPKQLDILSLRIQAVQLMEIAKLVHIIQNLAHQSQPFQVVLHLGLKPDVWVHAALLEVREDVLDEQLQ